MSSHVLPVWVGGGGWGVCLCVCGGGGEGGGTRHSRRCCFQAAALPGVQVLWWKSGLIPPLGTYQKGYWMDPFSLFWVEVILVQFAELKRCELALSSPMTNISASAIG